MRMCQWEKKEYVYRLKMNEFVWMFFVFNLKTVYTSITNLHFFLFFFLFIHCDFEFVVILELKYLSLFSIDSKKSINHIETFTQKETKSVRERERVRVRVRVRVRRNYQREILNFFSFHFKETIKTNLWNVSIK
jgi:hypothetical protein